MGDYSAIIKTIFPGLQPIQEAEARQIVRILKYCDYYDNRYWKHIIDEFPEFDRDSITKKDYTPTQLRFNWARFFVNRIAAFLFEETPGIEFESKQIDEDMNVEGYQKSKTQEEADDRAAQREALCYELWDSEHNNLALNLVVAARESEKTGAVAAKLVYKDGELRCVWRPRLEVFPIVEDDVDRIERVHFAAFEGDGKIFWVQTYEMRPFGDEGKKYCWMFERRYKIEGKAEDMKPIEVLYDDWVGNGDRILDFIPVELFPADKEVGEAFPSGSPLMDDLIPMINEYSMRLSDAADSLRFEMFCIRALINVSQEDEEGFKIGPGRMLKLFPENPDAVVDVKNLTSDFSWEESFRTFISEIKEAMHLVANIVQLTPSEVKGLGTLSGVAITLIFALSISMAKQKMKLWGPRLESLNQKMLKMLDAYEPDEDRAFLKEEDEYYLKNYMIPGILVPINQKEQLEMAIKKIENNLSSIHSVMNELGVENPDQLIAEIIAEKKMWEEAFKDLFMQAREVKDGEEKDEGKDKEEEEEEE